MHAATVTQISHFMRTDINTLTARMDEIRLINSKTTRKSSEVQMMLVGNAAKSQV